MADVAPPGALASGPLGGLAVGAMALGPPTNDERPAVWLSADGSKWTTVANAFSAPRGAGPTGQSRHSVTAVVATHTVWLAVGRQDPVCQLDCGLAPIRALAWTSSDGRKWTPV